MPVTSKLLSSIPFCPSPSTKPMLSVVGHHQISLKRVGIPTMWSNSPMKQSLLDFSSSKSFAKIRNRQCTKLAMGVAIVIAAALIWGEYPNINHVISPKWYNGLYRKEPFYVGAMLMLYSFWFSFMGISVLANSLFKLPMPIRLGTAASLQGYEDEESKRNSKIIIRMLITVIMMIALLLATCSGIKLMIRPISEDGLYTLTISVGLATVVFCLIYFIIGVIIMVELVGGLVSPNKFTEGHSGSSTIV